MNSKDRILDRINNILDKPINEGEAYLTAISLLENIYGPNSEQLQALKTVYQNIYETRQDFDRDWDVGKFLKGSLSTLKAEIEGDLIESIQSQARSEVLGDFLSLARESHDEGRKDVAAVLSSAALEDALKRCATEHGLDVQGKNMLTVVNALKSNNIIPKSQAKTLAGYTDFRNDALHAEWDKIDSATVIGVVEFTDEFLKEHKYVNRKG